MHAENPFMLALQIMKSDEDVRMISAEAPVLFAKVKGLTLCSVFTSHAEPTFSGNFTLTWLADGKAQAVTLAPCCSASCTGV